jgi:hypothetical protein
MLLIPNGGGEMEIIIQGPEPISVQIPPNLTLFEFKSSLSLGLVVSTDTVGRRYASTQPLCFEVFKEEARYPAVASDTLLESDYIVPSGL